MEYTYQTVMNPFLASLISITLFGLFLSMTPNLFKRDRVIHNFLLRTIYEDKKIRSMLLIVSEVFIGITILCFLGLSLGFLEGHKIHFGEMYSISIYGLMVIFILSFVLQSHFEEKRHLKKKCKKINLSIMAKIEKQIEKIERYAEYEGETKNEIRRLSDELEMLRRQVKLQRWRGSVQTIKDTIEELKDIEKSLEETIEKTLEINEKQKKVYHYLNELSFVIHCKQNEEVKKEYQFVKKLLEEDILRSYHFIQSKVTKQ